VREALFSMLAQRTSLSGARALDLYAGTGALGLEALSRGAHHVTFVEQDRGALAALEGNVAALAVGNRVRVLRRKVEDVLRATPPAEAPYDLVLVDPPYALVATDPWAAVLGELGKTGWLASDAVGVLEHASRDAPPGGTPFRFEAPRVYGDTSVSFFRT
jgi:16S rRNA (guanine966-N2)-methyltransferase